MDCLGQLRAVLHVRRPRARLRADDPAGRRRPRRLARPLSHRCPHAGHQLRAAQFGVHSADLDAAADPGAAAHRHRIPRPDDARLCRVTKRRGRRRADRRAEPRHGGRGIRHHRRDERRFATHGARAVRAQGERDVRVRRFAPRPAADDRPLPELRLPRPAVSAARWQCNGPLRLHARKATSFRAARRFATASREGPPSQ